MIATLVILRFQLPHAALAVFYGVHRSTITRAVGEIRPLLAARGFAVPGTSGLRLHTLSREEFVRIVTAEQPDTPAYFSYDAVLNTKERPTLEQALQQGLRPLMLDETADEVRGFLTQEIGQYWHANGYAIIQPAVKLQGNVVLPTPVKQKGGICGICHSS